MKKPNILLITSDQQHFNTLGAFNPHIKTPHLDRLVKEGTTFTRAYCPNPTCTPTRASIITGMHPSQHGAWTLGTKLPDDMHTLGDSLRSNHYRSALIGKAHFQPTKSTEAYPSIEAYPLLQDLDFWKTFNDTHDTWYGFDHVELARNHTIEFLVGQHYALWLEENGCEDWQQYFQKPTGTLEYMKEGIWEIPEKFHYNNWIAERTNTIIKEQHDTDQPFFVWASFLDPHPPYVVPEPYYSMYDPETIDFEPPTDIDHKNNPPHFSMTQDPNSDFSAYQESNGSFNHGMHYHGYSEKVARKQKAIYYGMITMMDKYIGKILDRLDTLGITDNTIVIFTTDHGHFIGQHGLMAKGPFMYEDMIKIPMIVRYPNKVAANKTSESLQSLVDLAPTLLSFTDSKVPNTMTGKNQKDVWLGEQAAARDHIICEHHHEPTTIHLKTYVDKDYKITVYYQQTYGELYDLRNDPEELNNLWHEPAYQQLKQDLLLKYIWAELEKEPMWMPRIAGA